MTERRTARLSDWLNGGMGALMVLAASWAGSKLVDVREEVASMKSMMQADSKRVDRLNIKVEKLNDVVIEVKEEVEDLTDRVGHIERHIKGEGG